MTSAVSQRCAIQKGNRPMPELTAPTAEIQFLQERNCHHTHPAQRNPVPGSPYAKNLPNTASLPCTGDSMRPPPCTPLRPEKGLRSQQCVAGAARRKSNSRPKKTLCTTGGGRAGVPLLGKVQLERKTLGLRTRGVTGENTPS